MFTKRAVRRSRNSAAVSAHLNPLIGTTGMVLQRVINVKRDYLGVNH